MNRLTFRARPDPFDPLFEVHLDGLCVGLVAQDRSVRPLEWTAIVEGPDPIPSYPTALVYRTIGADKDRFRAAMLLPRVVASGLTYDELH